MPGISAAPVVPGPPPEHEQTKTGNRRQGGGTVSTAPDATDEHIDNLATVLMDHPFADSEDLIFTVDRTMTAGEARSGARALADELASLGVQPGQAVGVKLPNGPDVVVAMAGIWLAGAVFVPINPRLPDAEIDTVVGPSAPAAVIDRDGVHILPEPRAYDAGTAFILWTSGTTGQPKPILHTHRGYGELLDRVLKPLRSGSTAPAKRPSPNLIPVSLALNAGIYNVLFGLRAGAPLVIMDRFQTTSFAELVRRFEIRSTVLPPAAIAMLNDDPTITDLAPLKYVRSITAPLSPLQAKRFTEMFGVFVLNSYGQAEVGEVIGWTASDAKTYPEKVGAVGRPHKGVGLRIVGDDGNEVATGQTGELRVRPPNMASGYASGAELADRIDADGYLATGDLGRIDEEGFVWIEGRSSDLINRGGNKVFPDEVEEVICLAPSVSEAAVVGAADERLGEVPVAFVVSSDELDPEALTALCRAHLTPYKIPVDFVRVDTLPRSEVGKVLRRELAARYER
jgi:acyl-CoA synthetase (AMP-forming)/AMP-acid ligase II